MSLKPRQIEVTTCAQLPERVLSNTGLLSPALSQGLFR